MSKSKKFKLSILPLLLGSMFVTGCNSTMHDYVHDGSVELYLDYHNTDFYTQGIVEVELAPKGCIDGDTAHFYPKSGSSQGRLKARFYGVDTPESTGSLEPYGADASDFTKQKLMNANENGTIVVSSPATKYTAPSPDSTGSRYVLMIWVNETVKNAPIDQLYSLNLWLVQEGLSLAKGLDDMPQYKETFAQAEAQARKNKLKMFSGKEDPRYNYGEYIDISLLQIAHEIQEGLEDPDYTYTFDGANIHFTGTVAGLANNTLYLQNFYSENEGSDKEEGEYVGINIFTGMGAIPTRFTREGAYIEVYGTAKHSQYGFQVTSCTFPLSKRDEDPHGCKVLLTPEENTTPANTYDDDGKKLGHALKVFEYSSSELDAKLKAKDYSCLFSPITVTDAVTATATDSYVSDKNYASLKFEGHEFGIYCAFQYTAYPDDEDKKYITWTTLEEFDGKRFNIVNCVLGFHEDNKGDLTLQFCPSSSRNFRCLDAE